MDFKQINTRFLFSLFIFIFLIIGLLNFLAPTIGFSSSKQMSYNLLNKLTYNKRVPLDDIALVVIDDKSLLEIGRWPWNREYYLEIFDYLENYTKTKVFGYDGLIISPDNERLESDKKFFSEVKKFKKLTSAVSFLYNEFPNNINEKEYDEFLKTKSDIKIIDKRSKKYQKISNFKSFTVLQKQYLKNINSLGLIINTSDNDEYTRKITQLINYKGDFIPHMSLVLYSGVTGIKEYILTDKFLYGFSNNYSLKVPVQNINGMVKNYICYYNSQDDIYSHKTYSASDIIYSYRAIKQGKKPIINPSEFNNKIVIVGANAQALALADVKRTPVSESFSGADIVATNLDNLLQNSFFTETNKTFDFVTCILIVLFVFWFVNILPSSIALLSSLSLGLVYFIFTYFMYSNKIAVDFILPEFYILFALLCGYTYKYLVENSKKNKIQKAMGKYLSNEVMQNVVNNIDNIALGGKRADITVLFADIRNFTSISENMDAASTSMILNEYFSAMVPIIEEHNGVLNKFMGDAVLAIFGEPKKSDNHALDAVKCGYRMLQKVKYLQEKWIDEGKPKIEIGIGISSGDAFVGNIG